MAASDRALGEVPEPVHELDGMNQANLLGLCSAEMTSFTSSHLVLVRGYATTGGRIHLVSTEESTCRGAVVEAVVLGTAVSTEVDITEKAGRWLAGKSCANIAECGVIGC